LFDNLTIYLNLLNFIAIGSSVGISSWLENLYPCNKTFVGIKLKNNITYHLEDYYDNKHQIHERLTAFENSQVIDTIMRDNICSFRKILSDIDGLLNWNNFYSVYGDNFCLAVYLSLLASKFGTFTDSDLISFFMNFKKYDGLYINHFLDCGRCINHQQLYILTKDYPIDYSFTQVNGGLYRHIYNTPRVDYLDVMQSSTEEKNIQDCVVLDRLIVFYGVNILLSTMYLSTKLYNL